MFCHVHLRKFILQYYINHNNFLLDYFLTKSHCLWRQLCHNQFMGHEFTVGYQIPCLFRSLHESHYQLLYVYSKRMVTLSASHTAENTPIRRLNPEFHHSTTCLPANSIVTLIKHITLRTFFSEMWNML